MKKPIRFNLRFQNGKESVQIRNLDDLEENMNINDLLDSFLSCDLERWLRQRNETERADKISKLEHNDDEETLLRLFEFLDLGYSESEIKDSIGGYAHQKEKMRAHLLDDGKESDYGKDASKTIPDPAPKNNLQLLYINNIIEDRKEKYKELKERIKNVPLHSNFSSHKALIDELLNDYSVFFELDWISFFYEMLPERNNSFLPYISYDYEKAAEEGKLRDVLNKSDLSDSQKNEVEQYFTQTNSGLTAIFLLWASAQWHNQYHALIDYSKLPSEKKISLEELIMCFRNKTDPYHPDLYNPVVRNWWWSDKNRKSDFMCGFSANQVNWFYFHWARGRADIARFFDKPNEMNDNPEKPIKLVCAATRRIDENKWVTIVERGKRIFVLYRGEGIALQSDSTTEPDKSVYDGLRIRYKSRYNQSSEADKLVFLEIK